MDRNHPDTGNSPPPVIPDHQLLRRIGSGSYGEVWLARNMMGMYRAVKIVYRKSFETQRPFDRELSGIQKFEPISRSHEGFVDVLQVGIKPDEYFYYVMELGDDQTTGQAINPEQYLPKTLAKGISGQGRLPFDECLKLGLALTDALSELHKHDLVHRDVKPSNIIFVHGVPKLADIGLVTTTGEARTYVGTEGFIPPEGPGAPNADVYGVGKVLYECSTGKDRHAFPELPTLLDQWADHEKLLELNEIILHACKTDARQRYQSAWDMHSDLLVLANGKSVKRLKFLEHRLAAAKRIAGLASVALILCAAILFQIYRERRVFVEARQRQIGADVANGNNAMDSGDALGSLPYFAEALYLNKKNANQREGRVKFAAVLAQCPTLVQMWFAPQAIFDADFHPAGHRVLITEWGGRAQIFDIQTGQPVSPQFGQTDRLRGGAFSPDGSLVVTASEDKTAGVWNAGDGALVFKLEHPDKVMSAAFSPDGKHLLTACVDGVARLWNSESKELERKFIGHTNAILYASFSHNGRMIVTTSRDNTVRIWDAATGLQAGPSLEHSTWVNCARFSPDDREVATACFDRKVRVWELSSRREILPQMTHDQAVNSVQFSPDGRFIITAGFDRTVRLWLAADHRPAEINPIFRHGERLTCAAFAGDGHQIVTTCMDGTVRIWDLAGMTVASAPLHRAFSDDGRRYATTDGRKIQTWDVSSNKLISTSSAAGVRVRDLKLSPGGNFIFARSLAETAADTNATAEVFEAATGRQIALPFLVPRGFTNFSLSRDGQRLLAVGGKNARTWNTLAGTPLSPLLARDANILSAAFSPDGKKVALGSGRWVAVCDAVTGEEFFPGLEHEAPVQHVEFSPDGTRLVACCSDRTFARCSAKVWATATGRLVGSPLRHNDGVLFAAFSPDGNRVATASEDYTARVWDIQSGTPLSPSLKLSDQVQAVAFSPDGKWVATASKDRTARVWSVATGEPLTPPLKHLAKLDNVKFLAAGRRLLTSNASGECWLWQLATTDQPVEDLQKLSYLLTSGTIAPAEAPETPTVGSLKSLWEDLRTHQPSLFVVSAEQVAAWDEFETEQDEADKQWYAAAFHAQRLLSTAADKSEAEARWERAKSHLTETSNAQSSEPGDP